MICDFNKIVQFYSTWTSRAWTGNWKLLKSMHTKNKNQLHIGWIEHKWAAIANTDSLTDIVPFSNLNHD